MKLITADSWDAEVWGAATPSPTGTPRPKLCFLFSENDHWVANETRDSLIARRGALDSRSSRIPSDSTKGENGDMDTRPVHDAAAESRGADSWKPLMEIDESGFEHAFCIRMCCRRMRARNC